MHSTRGVEQGRWSRRTALRTLGAGVAASVAAIRGNATPAAYGRVRGAMKQSVCQWCYAELPLDQLAAGAVRIGLQSIELIGPREFRIVKPFGLTCAITWGAGGLNRTANHDRCEADFRTNIEFAAAEGIPNVICFSGNRDGMPDDEGLENCAIALKRVVGLAEKKRVTICLELFNSKIDHPDYMADSTSWGVALVKRVGSPRFKLLYDIYHMQIMEGDVIRTIRDNKEYLGHFHTGGVPGRHNINHTQELNYPAIVRAILETGYTGFLGQEFVPTGDPLASLEEGVRICDV